MPSPFPGMNPFLEQKDVWQDFHDSYVPALRDALSPQISPAYVVKIEEHLFIHELSAEQRLRLGSGDVSVARRLFLEIRDRQNRELVAVLELLSPSNKATGPDREQYLAKRGNLLRTTAHLIEIDLLRGGPRLTLEQAPPSDYYVMVSRAEDRPGAEFWPLRLRAGLPLIPIPLRPPWPDAKLDLQEVLHTVYDRAYYKDYIYDGVPEPPLGDDDAKWASALLGQLPPAAGGGAA